MDLVDKNNISMISQFCGHVSLSTRLMNMNRLWRSARDGIAILVFFYIIVFRDLKLGVPVCVSVGVPMGVSVGVPMGVSVGGPIGVSVGVVATVTCG